MATQPNYRGALTHYLCHPESFTLQTARQYGHDGRALVEPAAVGMHAAMLADVKPGKKIIILGSRLYWFDDVASVQMPRSNGNCRR